MYRVGEVWMVVDEAKADQKAEEAPSKDLLGQALDGLKAAPKDMLALGIVLIVGLVVALWPFFVKMWGLWTEPDSYYNHGLLVPLMAAYLIYERREKIKKLSVKPQLWAIAPFLFLLYVNHVTARTPRDLVQTGLILSLLLFGALFVGGWKWTLFLSPAILFLAFAMPIWEGAIDRFTQPLQVISTDLSYAALQAFGANPLKIDSTMIATDNFEMYVGVPCSGLKTILAVLTLTVFFVLQGRLKWYFNAFLLAIAVPLAIMINGFRISLIGLVGNEFGHQAGMQFHDWSGYLSLIVLIYILFKMVNTFELLSQPAAPKAAAAAA